MFDAFPSELSHDVSTILKLISRKTYNCVRVGTSENGCTYTLLDGQVITFPYRIYYLDECPALSSLTFEQTMIYHCLYSRSCNGFVRETHIKEILKEDYPDWCLPYILKLSDEYIAEILEAIYQELNDRDTDKMKRFCRLNMQVFLCGHDRMISYWNEFYRHQCYFYKNYIGKKLYSQCYGYTRSMEKERSADTQRNISFL